MCPCSLGKTTHAWHERHGRPSEMLLVSSGFLLTDNNKQLFKQFFIFLCWSHFLYSNVNHITSEWVLPWEAAKTLNLIVTFIFLAWCKEEDTTKILKQATLLKAGKMQNRIDFDLFHPHAEAGQGCSKTFSCYFGCHVFWQLAWHPLPATEVSFLEYLRMGTQNHFLFF